MMEVRSLNQWRDLIVARNRAKGFRDQMVESLTPEQAKGPIGRLVQAATMVANQHSETSEFWEAFRKGRLDKPCDKEEEMKALGLEPLTYAEEEVADIIIRALDLAEAHGVDVDRAMAIKHAYNTTREHLHGDKKA